MSQDHEAAQQHTTQPQQTPAEPQVAGLEGITAAEITAATAGTLLDNPLLASRANAPVRQATMQRMQQSYGNRATRRYVQRRAGPAPVAVQRDAPGGAGAAAPAGAPAPAAPGAAGATPAQGLIVDDAAETVGPGQMKRGAFIAQLRAAAEAAANEAVAGTPYADMVRPEFEKQFGQYAGLSAQALEQTIRQQVPGAAGATSAGALIPVVATHVREAVRQQVPQGGVTGAVADVAQSAVNAVSGVVGMFFKARDGGAQVGESAAATAAQLQGGTALPSGVRSGLEAAYGADFSGVRVHTDSAAAHLADGYNARAFTVGQDVAFGTGEYQPGTPVGDALIAHELAHVVQQGQGTAGPGVLQKGPEGEAGLEEDADKSALGAVLSLWGGARTGLTNIAQNAVPALRSGLRLSRCSSKGTDPKSSDVALGVFWAVIGAVALPPGHPGVPDPQVAQGALDIIQGVARNDFYFWYTSASGEHGDPRFSTINWRAYQDQSVKNGTGTEWGGVWPLFKADLMANTVKRGHGVSVDL